MHTVLLTFSVDFSKMVQWELCHQHKQES